MANPTMIPVESSNLEAVGRDGPHLFVRFKGTDKKPAATYRYDNAADLHHDKILADESPGRYFHYHIRHDHKGIPV